MKIPKDMDFSAIDRDPPHIVRGFEAKQLQGTWYKVRRGSFVWCLPPSDLGSWWPAFWPSASVSLFFYLVLESF